MTGGEKLAWGPRVGELLAGRALASVPSCWARRRSTGADDASEWKKGR